MTSAPKLKSLDPRDEMLCDIVSREIKKRQRAARRNGDTTLTQERIAFEVFGHNQQWLSRRLVGEVAFTPAELLDIGDWLDINVLEWLERAKALYPGPGGGIATSPYPPLYLASSEEMPELTDPLRGWREAG